MATGNWEPAGRPVSLNVTVKTPRVGANVTGIVRFAFATTNVPVAGVGPNSVVPEVITYE
jgi:hypothetical protein